MCQASLHTCSVLSFSVRNKRLHLVHLQSFPSATTTLPLFLRRPKNVLIFSSILSLPSFANCFCLFTLTVFPLAHLADGSLCRLNFKLLGGQRHVAWRVGWQQAIDPNHTQDDPKDQPVNHAFFSFGASMMSSNT